MDFEVEHFGPRTRATADVAGLPLEARFEEVYLSDGGDRSILAEGRIFRDSQGRTRREVLVHDRDGNVELISIHLPERRIAYLLQPESRTAVQLDVGPPEGTTEGEIGFGWLFPGNDAVEVGGGVVDEFDYRRYEVTGDTLSDSGAVEEVWISDALRAVLFEGARVAGGERTWRLYEIRRVEPAASLLEVPSEYTLLPQGVDPGP